MRKILLFATLMLTGFCALADYWTPIGKALWQEGIVTVHRPEFIGKSWEIIVEQSEETPSLIRMQPYLNHVAVGSDCQKDPVYVYIHIDNMNKIYIEPFNYHFFVNANNNHYYEISQRCPENNYDSGYYGKIQGNSISFPEGSFRLVAPCWLNDPEWISNEIHKITFPDGIPGMEIKDSWVKIGTGVWIDPIIRINGSPLETAVDIEKSIQNSGKYRFNLFGEQIIVHAENPKRVYIEPYNVQDIGGLNVHIMQKCVENGLSGDNYGKLENDKIIIPANCFIGSVSDTGQSLTGINNCELTFPNGFDITIKEDNGVFMGIIGFNDEINSKPIAMLNGNTKGEFTSFVEDLEMGNATLLYYAVDQAIGSLKAHTFPDNLNNVILLTFTDGLDQGSLAMKPEHRTSKGYADYLSDLIGNTTIQGHPIEAYAIGLKSEDVYDDELFMYNLQSVASDDKHISPVNNISEMQQKLSELLENLNRQTTQRVVTIKVPMMSHGDKYRFTLDHNSISATNSNIWFEGEFNIDNMSLDNVIYNGFTSASGKRLSATQEGIKLTFTLNDCRDLNGEILDVDQDGIDQWQYIPSREIWNHNIENAKAEDIDIENIKSSVGIMFALDCSTSLGELFPLVKSTANQFINSLAGYRSAIKDIKSDTDEDFETNDPDVEIYNLQGLRVTNPRSGIYIIRKGSKVKKLMLR